MVEDEGNGKLKTELVTAIPWGKVSSLKHNHALHTASIFH